MFCVWCITRAYINIFYVSVAVVVMWLLGRSDRKTDRQTLKTDRHAVRQTDML